MDHHKRLLRRRILSHTPIGLPPTHIRDLDDPLIVSVHELVDVDPRPGLLPDCLDDASGLPDHPSGLIIRAEYPKEHVMRRRRRGFLGFRDTGAAADPPVVGVAMVVVSRFAPRRRLRIVLLIVVVALLRSRSLHSPLHLGFLSLFLSPSCSNSKSCSCRSRHCLFSVRLEREREILGFFFFSFFSFDVVELDAADDCCYKAVESSVLRFLLGFCRCLCWKVFVEIPERARDSARGRKKEKQELEGVCGNS
eukprot:TRINITY_DN5798_c0_g1_i1.p1 TRINITY_DN5798_c0_g1~~TRINITY_DN5798_c0_g1_i1.p1  ORF type:complete len:283 (+),score=39.23 TRINITY_DN5798_c0_g1_i1:98-850(+)